MSGIIEQEQLWERVQQVARRGKASGALFSIPTQWVRVNDHQFDFIVRVAENIERKHREAATTPELSSNPFLPPDPELFVGYLSETHSVVLNKFNVVDNHLLMVTREYQSQDSVLNVSDFEAMCFCLSVREGVAFYNGGTTAGASQPHKHLQWVPAPLVEGWSGAGGMQFPIEVAFLNLVHDDECCVSAALPFDHVIAPLHKFSGALSAEVLEPIYRKMLAELGIDVTAEDECSRAYNLLLTNQWMLMVPRHVECYDGISVNSLAFAGSLFVKNQADLDKIRQDGPLQILKSVAGLG